MTEEEANELSSCGHGCFIIGGPWISTNPICPEHGAESWEVAKEFEYEEIGEICGEQRGYSDWFYKIIWNVACNLKRHPVGTKLYVRKPKV